jgi:lipopolysaccharide export system protein LptC
MPSTTAHHALNLAPSAEATMQQSQRRRWAMPGGVHDVVVNLLKKALPIGTGIFGALLVTAPFMHQGEVSFVLDKNKVDMASERMRVTEALYRGEDDQGRPFSLRVGSAVQKSSRESRVSMRDMQARIQLANGGAVMTAQRGQYDMAREQVAIEGPIQFETANGYRLTTRDVDIDLNRQSLHSRGAVEGRMPTGTFRADELHADLDSRTVTLSGKARLRMEQFGRKGQP